MANTPRKPADAPAVDPLSQVHGEARADAPGNAEVQSRMDEAVEKGLLGVEVDPTPNEHYTVEGVTSGKPTPETDPEHAEQVRQDLRRR
jgi:hypothetical protein